MSHLLAMPGPPMRSLVPANISHARIDALVWVERAGLGLNWALSIDDPITGPIPSRLAFGESHGGRGDGVERSWYREVAAQLKRQVTGDGREVVLHLGSAAASRSQHVAALEAALPIGVRLADPLESVDRHHLLAPIAEAATPGVIWDGPATIATDGSVSHHTGHAGWGWISNRGAFGLGALGETRDVCHSELAAIKDAVARVRDGRQVEVLVDSTEAISLVSHYLREGDASTFVSRRRRALLRSLDRSPVREVTISKVAGHSGHPLNEGADRLSKLARRASESALESATVWKLACGIRDDVMASL